MPILLPRGAHVYTGLESFVRGLYFEHGYEEVITPQIFDKRLFEMSGHLPNYRENMYFAVTAEPMNNIAADWENFKKLREEEPQRPLAGVDELFIKIMDDHVGELEKFGQKPMNCPGHCLIFGQRRRSYRELPWRIADFGRLHRYERGGVVHGMARVRSFCQDDSHIFCTEEQLTAEIESFMRLFYGVYAAFGFKKIDIKLATRPEHRMGADELWDLSEKALGDALTAAGLAFEITPGEGAFYGPKLEFHIEDALKRSWQLGTLQLDYNLPQRFDLTYTGQDGKDHRPVMLHRAILGSLERFLAIYIEHTAGAFPVWLAPEQAVVITVSEKQNDYAQQVVKALAKRGLRARADLTNDKLGAKKRNARLMRVPYIVVVGDREAAETQVAPWARETGADLGAMPLEAFIDRLAAEAVPPKLPATPSVEAAPAAASPAS
jgi:threonyl-tRNA synthetase